MLHPVTRETVNNPTPPTLRQRVAAFLGKITCINNHAVIRSAHTQQNIPTPMNAHANSQHLSLEGDAPSEDFAIREERPYYPEGKVKIYTDNGDELESLFKAIDSNPKSDFVFEYQGQAGKDEGGLSRQVWSKAYTQLSKLDSFDLENGELKIKLTSLNDYSEYRNVGRFLAKTLRNFESNKNNQTFGMSLSNSINVALNHFTFDSDSKEFAPKSKYTEKGVVHRLYVTNTSKTGLAHAEKLTAEDYLQLKALAKLVYEEATFPELYKENNNKNILESIAILWGLDSEKEALEELTMKAKPFFYLARGFNETLNRLELNYHPLQNDLISNRLKTLFKADTLATYRSKNNTFSIVQSSNSDLNTRALSKLDSFIHQSEDEGRALCSFVTGSPTIGPEGFNIVISKTYKEDMLPQSSTCTNTLYLSEDLLLLSEAAEKDFNYFLSVSLKSTGDNFTSA